MPSAEFQVIWDAMQNKQQVTCIYQGRFREMCPHTLGYKNGQEKVLGFQFAGDSSKGLPPGGEWRCMFVAQISDVAARAGPWHTRDVHLKPQTCIDEIEMEIFG
jgi:hypothetical protein